MNLLNFMSNFADKESCVTYLKEQRGTSRSRM